MGLDKQGKLDLIAAKRGPLEHEQYAADLDLKVAQESDDERLAEEPQKRLDEINSKLDVLKREEEAVTAESD